MRISNSKFKNKPSVVEREEESNRYLDALFTVFGELGQYASSEYSWCFRCSYWVLEVIMGLSLCSLLVRYDLDIEGYDRYSLYVSLFRVGRLDAIAVYYGFSSEFLVSCYIYSYVLALTFVCLYLQALRNKRFLIGVMRHLFKGLMFLFENMLKVPMLAILTANLRGSFDKE